MHHNPVTRLPSRNTAYARKVETMMIRGLILTAAVLGLSPCARATMASNLFLPWEQIASIGMKFFMRVANVIAWYVVVCFDCIVNRELPYIGFHQYKFSLLQTRNPKRLANTASLQLPSKNTAPYRIIQSGSLNFSCFALDGNLHGSSRILLCDCCIF